MSAVTKRTKTEVSTSAPSVSHRGIFRLPGSVLSHLLSFLDTHTLARHVFVVCRAFGTQRSVSKLYTELTLKSSDTDTGTAIAERLLKLAGPNLRAVKVKNQVTDVLPLVARYASPAALRSLAIGPGWSMIVHIAIEQFIHDWQAHRRAFIDKNEGVATCSLAVTLSFPYVLLGNSLQQMNFGRDELTIGGFAMGCCFMCKRTRHVALVKITLYVLFAQTVVGSSTAPKSSVVWPLGV